MVIKSGITRIVFLFNNYVIKIPNFRYGHSKFLVGCYSNWSERNFYKTFLNSNFKDNFVDLVSPSYFCSFFGLIQIQAKCKLLERDLTNKEKKLFKPLCGKDNKRENFGIYKGKIVCLDYP